MKLKITFKSPEAVYYATKGLELNEDTQIKVEEIAAKFIKYGELLTVELDTETETCVVIPV